MNVENLSQINSGGNIEISSIQIIMLFLALLFKPIEFRIDSYLYKYININDYIEFFIKIVFLLVLLWFFSPFIYPAWNSIFGDSIQIPILQKTSINSFFSFLFYTFIASFILLTLIDGPGKILKELLKYISDKVFNILEAAIYRNIFTNIFESFVDFIIYFSLTYLIFFWMNYIVKTPLADIEFTIIYASFFTVAILINRNIPINNLTIKDYFLKIIANILIIILFSSHSMERFWSVLILAVTGILFESYSYISKYREISSLADTDHRQIFQIKLRGVNATAEIRENKFVVLAGSTANKTNTPSLQISYIRLRNQLTSENILVDNDAHYWVFTEDFPFESPSKAAAVVVGASLQGPKVWITSSGQTYGQWKDLMLKT